MEIDRDRENQTWCIRDKCRWSLQHCHPTNHHILVPTCCHDSTQPRDQHLHLDCLLWQLAAVYDDYHTHLDTPTNRRRHTYTQPSSSTASSATRAPSCTLQLSIYKYASWHQCLDCEQHHCAIYRLCMCMHVCVSELEMGWYIKNIAIYCRYRYYWYRIVSPL